MTIEINEDECWICKRKKEELGRAYFSHVDFSHVISLEVVVSKVPVCDICKSIIMSFRVTPDDMKRSFEDYIDKQIKTFSIIRNKCVENVNKEELKEKIVEYVRDTNKAFPEMPIGAADIARRFSKDFETIINVVNELHKERRLLDTFY